jgi:hypothetical protein
MVPPADVPEGGVELMLPDAEGELTEGELTLPEPGELTGLLDGELVLSPVPLELVAPVLPLLTEPDAPPLLMEPEAPGPDVVGDADGV